MIVDDLRQSETETGLERSARVRWREGEVRLRIEVLGDAAADLGGASVLAADSDDASPYLAAALPLALLRAEDLEVDGRVSKALLAKAEHIQGVYTAWNPWLRPIVVRAAGEATAREGGRAVACFFSRGVDSTYAAAAPRPGRPALTHLLFVDGLDLRHDAEVRAEEVRRAAEAADVIGLPLLRARTNLRELSEPLCDWEDMAGAGLSFVALSLAGGLARAVIPSSDSVMGAGACGMSPLLDPLFSTEVVAIEHEAPWRTRVGKIAWLAEHRPEALRRLKVCYAENRPDNCGRCGKCVLTMAGLLAAGALERAGEFPNRVPDDPVEKPAPPAMWSIRHEIAEGARALAPDGEPGRVREMLLDQLGQTGSWVDPASPPQWSTLLRAHQGRAIISLLRDGRAYPPIPGVPAPGRRPGWPAPPGLVRVLDPGAHRHAYGIGTVPHGRLVGELGVLCDEAPPGGVPVWLDAGGRLTVADVAPPRRRSAGGALRWALAPLGWRGSVPAREALRLVAWRARWLAAPRADVGVEKPAGPPAAASAPGEPAGWLHPEEAPDRLPLYAAHHPVTGDQLLSTSRWEASDMGYADTRLLGWLERGAPVTGGQAPPRPPVPWASRLGRTART